MSAPLSTVAFTIFLPEVMPQVVDCPEVLALNAIRNACVEFCSDTMWWQQLMDPVTLGAADFPYTFVPPTDANVVQPLSVTISGAPLAPTTQDRLDAETFDWRSAVGQPRAYYQPSPDQIDVYPRPNGTDTYDFVMRLAFAPLRSATTVAYTVHQYYRDAIAAGALTALLCMNQQPWFNMQLAQYYRMTFNSAKVKASVEAQKAYTRVGLRVQHRHG